MMLNFLKNIFKKNEQEHTAAEPAPAPQPEQQAPADPEVRPAAPVNPPAEQPAGTTAAPTATTAEPPVVEPQPPAAADDHPIETQAPQHQQEPESQPEAEPKPAAESPDTHETASADSGTHVQAADNGQPPAPAEPEIRSWASPVSPIAKRTLPETAHPAGKWVSGMAHAVADKADELELRAEIVAEEVKESVQKAAHETEHWAQGMAEAVADKLDELELRAAIIAEETAEGFKEGVEQLEHALEGSDALPQPQLLDDNDPSTDPVPSAPPPADAATDIDETHPAAGQSGTVLAHEKPPLDSNDSNDDSKLPPEAASAATVFAGDEETALSWAARLKQGLTKSRNHMAKSLAGVFGGGKIDEDLYEELETVLLTSDMGIEATERLMNEVRDRVSLRGLKDGNELRAALKEAVYDLLKPLEQPLVLPDNGQPFVIMMAGINGAGKTTSIGKLAKYFQAQGKSVMLAAGDTFRAAAREQLQEWGARNGVTVISQEKGDSAAVCFDAVEAAKARGIDVVLADTAGRLPTQLHLMEEIKKVKRVLQKSLPDAPHEVMVVLDANIGQNAVGQVRAFDDALGVTGLIVTKLDGTAKGGVLAALASDRAIPVRYIGVGESIDDLRPFNAKNFVDALLDETA